MSPLAAVHARADAICNRAVRRVVMVVMREAAAHEEAHDVRIRLRVGHVEQFLIGVTARLRPQCKGVIPLQAQFFIERDAVCAVKRNG